MARRGPIPKPTALRLIDGDRASRINTREPKPLDRAPVCPEGVSAEVRAIWDYTLAELTAMHSTFGSDRDALVCYCEAVVNHRKASRALVHSQVLIKGIHGNLVRNPALAVQRDSAELVRKFAQEFGLTPSARSRIETGRGDEEAADPFAAGY